MKLAFCIYQTETGTSREFEIDIPDNAPISEVQKLADSYAEQLGGSEARVFEHLSESQSGYQGSVLARLVARFWPRSTGCKMTVQTNPRTVAVYRYGSSYNTIFTT